MRNREVELEILGAEAIPAGFSDIDRVVQTSLEDGSIDRKYRQEFKPVGLVEIVGRWLNKTVI